MEPAESGVDALAYVGSRSTTHTVVDGSASFKWYAIDEPITPPPTTTTSYDDGDAMDDIVFTAARHLEEATAGHLGREREKAFANSDIGDRVMPTQVDMYQFLACLCC